MSLKLTRLCQLRGSQCCLLTFLTLLMLGIHRPALAQKTDLIYLENGDRVTGEIKEMEQGRLRLKTDSFVTTACDESSTMAKLKRSCRPASAASTIICAASLSTCLARCET